MAKEAKPVLVTIVSCARTGEESDPPMRLRCHGKMRETSDGCMLRYEEVQSDPDTGVSVTQDVVLSIHPERVTMTRIGQYGTTMVFAKDRRFEGAYHTPYGDLDLALFATQVNCQIGPESGSVHLEYQLDMQGNYAAVQVIDVTYTTEGARPC